MLAKSFKSLGQFLLRYGLAVAFIWLGLMKLKNSEADYLKDVLSNSAMLGWLLKYITPYAFSQLVAYLQMLIGIMIAAKPVARKLSFVGGVLATIVLFLSVTTLFTSSYVWLPPYGFPELSKLGQSILKDVILLGAAMWCVGDSA
ncbi:DUF417 family protein [Carboxylicivirga mesophila]|uniref:DUF417 family protein n=1 Tax=Carboxylicivirga mesophila TaxID=1166478 RepID=A0ABS5K436_9BACT|nr:DUF417 family protein [Carboxylicivirga mesophila]MBS2209794.1 DUF417 family protein [Carboxylicivirga mesophila]